MIEDAKVKLYEIAEALVIQAELTRLREENQRLKTQLSGITQYGSVDAAELQRLREENKGLAEAIKAIDKHVRESNHNTPAYRYFANLCEKALAKHKQPKAGGGE